MEDCEDWISGVEGTGPEWDWKVDQSAACMG